MEIKLNRAYTSPRNDIQFPIFQLIDESYLCITYSIPNENYYISIYTEDDFIKCDFVENSFCDGLFKRIAKENVKLTF